MRSGLDRPRWRSKLRHRLDRHKPVAPKPGRAEFERWLADAKYCNDITELERIDLTEFIRSTAHLSQIPPWERLRQLAIAAEAEATAASQPRGWLALERIYQTAFQLNALDPVLLQSRALAAIACAPYRGPDDVVTRIVGVALSLSRRAVELRPDDADLRDTVGQALYCHPRHSTSEALAMFDEALTLNPSLAHARLYRAHCLQDTGLWREAAQAYSAVDPNFFTEHLAWRYDLLREQRAWCLLKAGDETAALTETARLIERYERQPQLARFQPFPHLRDLTEPDPSGELLRRFQALLDIPAEEDP